MATHLQHLSFQKETHAKKRDTTAECVFVRTANLISISVVLDFNLWLFWKCNICKWWEKKKWEKIQTVGEMLHYRGCLSGVTEKARGFFGWSEREGEEGREGGNKTKEIWLTPFVWVNHAVVVLVAWRLVGGLERNGCLPQRGSDCSAPSWQKAQLPFPHRGIQVLSAAPHS